MKVKYLKEALKYDAGQYDRVIAQHSLGVALGKLHRHSEAIECFDSIIENELSKQYGPSQSLVVAARTKKISLRYRNPKGCNDFLDELISRCVSIKVNEQIIEELKNIKENE
mgnify:FL=1